MLNVKSLDREFCFTARLLIVIVVYFPACRYTKGAWSECDKSTNQRKRSLTLKKGDSSCEPSKTITKKCKKGHYHLSSFII